MRLAVSAAVAAALAAGWAVAAVLLWHSSVPALHLQHLDPRPYFTARELHDAASYSRGARWLWVLTTIAQLGALAVFARFGVRWARESAAGRMGTGMLLGMLGFALVWAVQLPFAVLEVWWARHSGLDARELPDGDARELARARRQVHVPLPRARDRHGARRQGRRLVVAARGAVLRRARAPLLVRDAVPARRAAARRARSCARPPRGSSASSTCSTSRSRWSPA